MRLAWTAGQSNDALADETFTFLSNALRQTTILCLQHIENLLRLLRQFFIIFTSEVTRIVAKLVAEVGAQA